MRSKRLLTELLEYLELFEEAFPHEEELSLQSFITFASSLLNTPSSVILMPHAA